MLYALYQIDIVICETPCNGYLVEILHQTNEISIDSFILDNAIYTDATVQGIQNNKDADRSPDQAKESRNREGKKRKSPRKP